MKLTYFVVACCLLGPAGTSVAQTAPVSKTESNTGIFDP